MAEHGCSPWGLQLKVLKWKPIAKSDPGKLLPAWLRWTWHGLLQFPWSEVALIEVSLLGGALVQGRMLGSTTSPETVFTLSKLSVLAKHHLAA